MKSWKLALACAPILAASAAYAQTFSISIGVRETGTTASLGQNGGTTNGIEWINLDGLTLDANGTWQKFTFNFGTDPVNAFAGATANGTLSSANMRGTLENIRIRNSSGILSPFALYLDDVVNTVSGTDVVIADFETAANGTPLAAGSNNPLLQSPFFSGSTNANLTPGSANTAVGTLNMSQVTTEDFKSGAQSQKQVMQFANPTTTNWVRDTTFNSAAYPNPTIDFTTGNTLSFWLKAVIATGAEGWIKDGSGDWTDAANWKDGAVPNATNAVAKFLGVLTAPATVTLTEPVLVNTITFDSPHKYTIVSNDPVNNYLILSAPTGFTVNLNAASGTHEIAAPMELTRSATIAANPTATLLLTGDLIRQPGQTPIVGVIGGGTVQFGNVTSHDFNITDAKVTLPAGKTLTSMGNIAGPNPGDPPTEGIKGTVRVQNGSSFTINGTVQAQRLFGSGTSTINVGSTGLVKMTQSGASGNVSQAINLNIASGGKIDLVDNDLVINYPVAGPSPEAAIRAALIAGRGGAGFGVGDWNGASGIAASAASASPIELALGYANNGDLPLGSYTTFDGLTVDATTILVKYTRGADATLDGIVNDDDVTIVGAFYNDPSSGHWYKGDFDYDGMCDDDDVTVLGATYDPSAPALSAAYLAGLYGDDFADAFIRGQAMAVPEPATLSLLGLAGLMGLRRRRA